MRRSPGLDLEKCMFLLYSHRFSSLAAGYNLIFIHSTNDPLFLKFMEQVVHAKSRKNYPPCIHGFPWRCSRKWYISPQPIKR